MAVFKTENHQGLNSKANSPIQQRNMEGEVPFSLLLNSHIQLLLLTVPTGHPLVPRRDIQLAFPHVKSKGHTCETPVSLKEENARLAILHSRFFHLQAGAILSLWKNNLFLETGVQTTYRGQNFRHIRRLAPYASAEAAPALARALSVKHSLPRAELLWQNSLFSCKIQKESLNSFAKVLSTLLKQEGSSQMQSEAGLYRASDFGCMEHP